LCSVRRDDLPLNRTDGQGTRHAREALARSATGWGLAQASHALAWPLTSRRPAALRTRAATAARPSPSPTCSACAPGRPLPPRSQQALPADGPARASPGASHHRHGDVPRDGHAVLAGAGRGGDEGVRVSCEEVPPPSPILRCPCLAADVASAGGFEDARGCGRAGPRRPRTRRSSSSPTRPRS
jgi:hypothetical protein